MGSWDYSTGDMNSLDPPQGVVDKGEISRSPRDWNGLSPSFRYSTTRILHEIPYQLQHKRKFCGDFHPMVFPIQKSASDVHVPRDLNCDSRGESLRIHNWTLTRTAAVSSFCSVDVCQLMVLIEADKELMVSLIYFCISARRGIHLRRS